MFRIGCDEYNRKYIDAELIENFQAQTKPYNIIVANWTNIFWHMRNNDISGITYIVHQPTDNSRVSHLLKNKQANCWIVGDGIGSNYNKHISSPWSRFIWMGNEFLQPNNERTHWTCLMSKSRPHRQIIEQWFLKNLDVFDYAHDFVYDECQHIDQLGKYMFRKTVPHSYLKHQHDDFVKTGVNTNWADADLIDAYSRSKIELVSETETSFFFITEKTIKPIRAGIPFVIVGCHHYLKKLRKLGFKTFSPYIDESYDDEEDTNKRIELACKSFKNYITARSINNSTIQSIVVHNQANLKHIRTLYNEFESNLVNKIHSICKKSKHSLE